MAIDNDTKNELSRESTRLRSKLLIHLTDEFFEFVMDEIGLPEGVDSVEFLDECVGFLLAEFRDSDLENPHTK